MKILFDKIVKIIKSNKDLLLILFSSFVLIGLFSMASPIYPFNDMADLNTWLAQGKMLAQGQILYKDVYEPKGPLQLIPFVIAGYFKNSLFVFYVLESLLFFTYGFFIYKIAKLYCKKPLTAILLSMFITATSITFLNTGTTEELTLFVYPASLYIFFERIEEEEYLNNRDCFIVGVLQSLLLWSKFTLCIFSLGLCFFMIYWHLKGHEDIKGQILWFFMGLLSVTITVLLYFTFTSALYDLFRVYFYNNIFIYGIKGHFDFLEFEEWTRYIYLRLKYIYGILFIAFFMAALTKLKDLKQIIRSDKFMLIMITGVTVFAYLMLELNYSVYYGLPLFSFAVYPVIIILNSDKKWLKAITIVLLLSYILFFQNTHLEKLQFSKEDYVQYKIYDYIKESGKHKILTRTNNSGFFYYTDNLPFNRYFTDFCIDLPEIHKELADIVNNKKADFIITGSKKYIRNYHIAIEGRAPNHLPEFFAYLFGEKEKYYLYEADE